MDLTRPRAYVYHKTKEPKMIYAEEAQEWYDKGWKNSPAYFFDMEKHGLDPGNSVLVQSVGDSIEEVKEAVNKALNLQLMTKRELVEYAKEHLGTELNMELTKPKLVEALEGILALQEG